MLTKLRKHSTLALGLGLMMAHNVNAQSVNGLTSEAESEAPSSLNLADFDLFDRLDQPRPPIPDRDRDRNRDRNRDRDRDRNRDRDRDRDGAIRILLVECGSYGRRYNRCPIFEHVRNVRLLRQHSNAPCIRGISWGYDDRGIWVANSCRATFRVSANRHR